MKWKVEDVSLSALFPPMCAQWPLQFGFTKLECMSPHTAFPP